ncbi:unnamed protein product, partial [marine sediment metagenome]
LNDPLLFFNLLSQIIYKILKLSNERDNCIRSRFIELEYLFSLNAENIFS